MALREELNLQFAYRDMMSIIFRMMLCTKHHVQVVQRLYPRAPMLFKLKLVDSAWVGGTPYNRLYREVPPERGTFFRFQVYERVGILLIEVYGRVDKSIIWVCTRAHKG